MKLVFHLILLYNMHKNSSKMQREINIFQFLFCTYCTLYV
nr:MAG TPA: hypothetical protein [Caudoviricetes sp.]